LSNESPTLSNREMEVLQLVAKGATNQEIARRLHISNSTVKTHLRNIFKKLGVISRTEAVTYAIRQGWLRVGESAAAAKEVVVSPIPMAPPRIGWMGTLYFLLPLLLIVAFYGWHWRYHETISPTWHILSDQGQNGQVPQRTNLPRWQALVPMPVPRSRMAAAVWKGKFVFAGGENRSGHVGVVAIYDPERNVWGSGQAQSQPASNVSGVVLGDLFYLPGGTLPNGQISNRLAIYNLARDQWETGTALPHPLTGYALALFDQQIYLFGGWDGQKVQDQIYRFDTRDKTWSLLGTLPQPLLFAAAASDQKCIYLAGGWNGNEAVTDSYCFHPDTGKWERLPSLQIPRQGAAATVQGNAFYILGGETPDTGQAFGERFDLLSRTWARIETPYPPSWNHLALLSDGWNLYAFGGWANTYLAVSERYQASFRNFIPFGPVREKGHDTGNK